LHDEPRLRVDDGRHRPKEAVEHALRSQEARHSPSAVRLLVR
jgi:hypothetical protein